MEFILKFVTINEEITIKDPQIRELGNNHFEVKYECEQVEFDEITKRMKKSPIVTFKINDDGKSGSMSGSSYDYQNKELTIKLVGVSNR